MDKEINISTLAKLASEAQAHPEWWSDPLTQRQFMCSIKLRPLIGKFEDPFMGIITFQNISGVIHFREAEMHDIPAQWLPNDTKAT